MADERSPEGRAFKLEMKNCFTADCSGTLEELSYYERNNWVTAEYRCTTCGKEFTVKIES